MEQDYDKIFASNASSSQEWEDENYLKGWGFLGQTPPPYQLFDSLFKRLDLKTKELYDEQKKSDKKYVPLTGGTMTGLLKLFTGSTVPTPAEQDNSKQITNTEWVQTWVKSFVSKLNENLEVETQEDGHFSCPALGITGLMAQNGYICLGKLFGNLILQWGINVSMRIDAIPHQVPFNITMPGYLWSNATINSGDIPDIVIVPYIQNANANGLQILIDYETGHTYVPGTSVSNVLWIAIGRG